MRPGVVEIWCDGSGLATGGPGGWGAVLRYAHPKTGEVHEREISGSITWATNNRAEQMALLVALQTITGSREVHVFTDSEYLMHPFTKGWLDTWRRRGWRKTSKPDNVDPETLYAQCAVCGYVEATHIMGAPVCRFHEGEVSMGIDVDHKAVRNRDLWQALIAAVARHRSVTFEHVHGHAGHEHNERADVLAGAQRRTLLLAHDVC